MIIAAGDPYYGSSYQVVKMREKNLPPILSNTLYSFRTKSFAFKIVMFIYSAAFQDFQG